MSQYEDFNRAVDDLLEHLEDMDSDHFDASSTPILDLLAANVTLSNFGAGHLGVFNRVYSSLTDLAGAPLALWERHPSTGKVQSIELVDKLREQIKDESEDNS